MGRPQNFEPCRGQGGQFGDVGGTAKPRVTGGEEHSRRHTQEETKDPPDRGGKEPSFVDSDNRLWYYLHIKLKALTGKIALIIELLHNK
jgi:hypothetical protein